MRRTAVALASFLGVVPLVAVPAQAGDRVLPFVFTSDRDGDNEIYRVRGDGRVVELTHNDVTDSDAVWSPDGRELACVSDRDGDLEVFMMDSDGSARDAAWIVDRAGTDPHRLTSGESNDSFPDARP
jgi:TolB protein